MKYFWRIALITALIFGLYAIYQTYNDYFFEKAIVYWNGKKWDFLYRDLELLKSPLIWIPAIGAFCIGLFSTGVMKSLASLAYQTDKEAEIEKYKNIANTALEDAQYSIHIEKERLEILNSEYVNRKKNITDKEQQIRHKINQLREQETTLSEYQQKLENTKALLQEQSSEFKEKADNSNSSFRRLQRQKEKHIERIRFLEMENAMLKNKEVM